MIVFVLIVLFLGMTTVAIWGWTTIPADRRFPVAWGAPPAVEGTMGKRTGLLVWLLIGAWLFGVSLLAASDDSALAWAGVGLMVFFLTMEYRSVRRLSR